MQGSDSQLSQLDVSTSPFSFVNIGGPAGVSYNNIGYSIADGCLYGYVRTSGQRKVIKIDATGTITEFGPLLGTPIPSNSDFAAGDVSIDGDTLFLNGAGTGILYKVALNSKMVSLFIEVGVIGRLEGGHFGSRLNGDWMGPFGLNVPVIDNDEKDKELLPLSDKRTKAFYTAFLPAFVNNIKANEWDELYIQHIADEPIDANVESYIEISKFLKSLVPDLKVIEACHTHQLENMVDIWVPQMDFLKTGLDFYQDQQSKGAEAWYYTCLAPKGEWANRFVELPLIKTRLLHWVNFKYKIPGYLHWGFNFWGSNSGIVAAENPYDDVSGMIVSSGNILPGGDCWITYPGYKTIYPSIRLEAMRDGIVDYELLKMYTEKFPDEAKELVGTTVYGFEHYDINIGEFRKKRRKILEAL